jgi:serine/threonine protein phosphatase PrpC
MHARSKIRGGAGGGVEAVAASVPQEGHTANEDAFGILPVGHTIIALADGAGAAEQAARRIMRRFEALVRSSGDDDVRSFPKWSAWLRVLDATIAGVAQSTFLALAILDDQLVGASVGDSRAYLWTRDGACRTLTEGTSKRRLGTGQIEPFPIHAPFGRGDIVLLLSDGAWTPLSRNRLRETVARSILGPLSDVPDAIVSEAGRAGVADDMTVVAARRR